MILYDNNFLSDEQIEKILSFQEKTSFTKERREIIYFDKISLHPASPAFDLSFLDNKFKKRMFNFIRFQKYDESIEALPKYHGHLDIHNYIIFLNDDFEGGELEFECGIIIKPKKGSIVYFNNNEFHRVKNCKGTRYTLVLSGNKSIEFELFNVRKRNGLI